jgi:ribonuclease BN (tRNA processing enzyme)
MTLTVLGSGGSYAPPGGACSGYLVQSDTTNLWVDCGPGTLGNLQTHVPLSAVDAVLVSHQHPDHFGELPILYNALAFYVDRPPLPVFTTEGAYHLTTVVNGHDCRGPLTWTLIDETAHVDVGDIAVRFSRTDHPVETLAMRFESDGSSIVYSSDTGPAWTPGAFLDEVDLFLCEATVLAHQEGDDVPHLSARQAAALASVHGVGTLILTHRNPESPAQPYVAEAGLAFDGVLAVAEVGATFGA